MTETKIDIRRYLADAVVLSALACAPLSRICHNKVWAAAAANSVAGAGQPVLFASAVHCQKMLHEDRVEGSSKLFCCWDEGHMLDFISAMQVSIASDILPSNSC